MTIRGCVSLVALLPLLGACYTYAPIETTAAGPGTSVRARVSPAAATRLAPLLRVADARVITGTFIDSVSGGMIIEVPTIVPGAVGSSFETLSQRVSISRSELLELEARKVDRFRTGAIASAVAIAAGVVLYRAVRGDPGADRAATGGGADLRRPLHTKH